MSDVTIVGDAQNELGSYVYFPSIVYTIDKPEFLNVVKEVSNEHLVKIEKDLDDIYPVKMTGNFTNDERLEPFCRFIGETAWNILNSQGYAMSEFNVSFSEMWTQEHHKHSLMEQHTHGFGVQLVGFYFLDTPEKCSRVLFYDPRAGKVQVNLPEANMDNATPASNIINFEPKEGLMILSNSYLPHAFGRHAADEPIRFVHFNIVAVPVEDIKCDLSEPVII